MHLISITAVHKLISRENSRQSQDSNPGARDEKLEHYLYAAQHSHNYTLEQDSTSTNKQTFGSIIKNF